MKSFIIVCISLFSFICLGATQYSIECKNLNADTYIGKSELTLKSTLIVEKFNDYTLMGGEFNFLIKDGADYWTNQSVQIDKVPNKFNYNPRVYIKHAKFPRLSKDFFGLAEFIVSHDDLLSDKKEFRGVFILSWVEDHWGGTILTKCSKLKLK